MADIGIRIKQRREELGITQQELAKRMGYKSKATIGKVETGVNDISQSTVVKYSKALNTTIAYLMGWEDNLTEGSAIAVANIIKNTDDTEFIQKYNSLSEENKKEVHRFVDFLLSKNVPN